MAKAMTISKTTHRAAERCGLELNQAEYELNEDNGHGDSRIVQVVEIYPLDKGEAWEEYLVAYEMGHDGSFVYHGTCFARLHTEFVKRVSTEKAWRAWFPRFQALAEQLT